jgi:hypothetical protein
MSKAVKVKAPEMLGEPGVALWKRITSKYELRADELVTLEDVCAITDELHELFDEWDAEGRPRTTTGSMGQLVEHPHPKRMTDLRMKRNALWRQLKLPDDAVGEESNQQRSAAQSRWSQRGA